MAYPPCTIHLIRHAHRDDARGDHDDVIRLKPNPRDEDSYILDYTEARTYKKHTIRGDDDYIMEYIQHLFDVLCVDSEPFASVQFSFPGLPSTLIEMDDLKQPRIKRQMRGTLRFLFRLWPIASASSRRREEVEEEESEEEEVEEEEDNEEHVAEPANIEPHEQDHEQQPVSEPQSYEHNATPLLPSPAHTPPPPLELANNSTIQPLQNFVFSVYRNSENGHTFTWMTPLQPPQE